MRRGEQRTRLQPPESLPSALPFLLSLQKSCLTSRPSGLPARTRSSGQGGLSTVILGAGASNLLKARVTGRESIVPSGRRRPASECGHHVRGQRRGGLQPLRGVWGTVEGRRQGRQEGEGEPGGLPEDPQPGVAPGVKGGPRSRGWGAEPLHSSPYLARSRHPLRVLQGPLPPALGVDRHPLCSSPASSVSSCNPRTRPPRPCHANLVAVHSLILLISSGRLGQEAKPPLGLTGDVSEP